MFWDIFLEETVSSSLQFQYWFFLFFFQLVDEAIELFSFDVGPGDNRVSSLVEDAIFIFVNAQYRFKTMMLLHVFTVKKKF